MFYKVLKCDPDIRPSLKGVVVRVVVHAGGGGGWGLPRPAPGLNPLVPSGIVGCLGAAGSAAACERDVVRLSSPSPPSPSPPPSSVSRNALFS